MVIWYPWLSMLYPSEPSNMLRLSVEKMAEYTEGKFQEGGGGAAQSHNNFSALSGITKLFHSVISLYPHYKQRQRFKTVFLIFRSFE